MGNAKNTVQTDLIKLDEIQNKITQATEVISQVTALSRINTVSEAPLKVITPDKMAEITNKIQEINEKVYVFSRSTSQVSRKLQSLTMLFPADATYRVLHQIAAQIERKQQALLENIPKIKKEMVELDELKEKYQNTDDPREKAKLAADIEKKQAGIANSFSYIEATLKEIGFLLETYEEIKQNKNIPDEWDEEDFEKAEIRAHIEGAFRNAIRDFLVHGRIGMGTCEWFEQLGISPFEAITEVEEFIRQYQLRRVKGEKIPDYDEFYDFLNRMAEKYGDCYKKACKRIGINPDNLVSKKFTLILKALPKSGAGEENESSNQEE